MSSALNSFIVKHHLNLFVNIASILLMSETVNCPANAGEAY